MNSESLKNKMLTIAAYLKTKTTKKKRYRFCSSISEALKLSIA